MKLIDQLRYTNLGYSLKIMYNTIIIIEIMLQFNEAHNLDIEIRLKENCGKNNTFMQFHFGR